MNRKSLFSFLCFFLFSTLSFSQKKAPFSESILLNGGARAKSNYYSHVLYLRMMRKALNNQGIGDDWISIFSSDGDDKEPDQAILKEKYKEKNSWLFSHRKEMKLFRAQPKLINTVIQGKSLFSAKTDLFTKILKTRAKRSQKDNRPVFLFVTDHGTQNAEVKHTRNQQISMWNEEMSVRQLHKALQPFHKKKVVSVMSQCFSGGFFWSIFRKPGRFGIPTGNRCGFYATLPDRMSYGCFPQTKLKKQVGHAYRFIQAMSHSQTLNKAHEDVLLKDITPDIPVRSSDLYLKELLEGDALAEKNPLSSQIKSIMKKWKDKPYKGIQRDLELIGNIARKFGMVRPMNFSAFEMLEKNLQKKVEWYERAKNMWANVFATARTYHLQRFLKNHDLLAQQLKHLYPSKKAKKSAKKNTQKKRPKAGPSEPWKKERIKKELLNGFLKYVQARPILWKRLQLLYQNKKEMEEHIFQMETQQAAMQRMKILFIRIAGRLLLTHTEDPELQAHNKGLKRLLACEATPLHPTQKKKEEPTTQPWLVKSDSKLPLPSWFGISFRSASKKEHPFATDGAVVVENVYMNTPAEKAGIQVGDVILTMNGEELRETFEIRERVMLSVPGKKVPFQFIRKGKLQQGFVDFMRLTEPPSLKTRPILGLSLKTLLNAQSIDKKKLLPSLKTGHTLLFFWATWCGPCKAALPYLRGLQKSFPKLKLVTVSDEKPSVLLGWLQTKEKGFLPFVNVSDTTRSLSRTLQIRATPTFVLIHQGKVVYSKVGFGKMDKLEEKLKSILP